MPWMTGWKDIALCSLLTHIFSCLSPLMDLYGVWAWTQSNLVCVKSCCRDGACNTHSIPLPISLFLKSQWFSVCASRRTQNHHKVLCQKENVLKHGNHSRRCCCQGAHRVLMCYTDAALKTALHCGGFSFVSFKGIKQKAEIICLF